ncbi:hypothetical protein EDB84DRAFT_1444549 [Lactarius hengduanensis]|nr:hypothetical protein EDB84DRAFT_1444549 [Lactarius hengduanensis]
MNPAHQIWRSAVVLIVIVMVGNNYDSVVRWIVRGNPGVDWSYPYPYPEKPVPASHGYRFRWVLGTGLDGYCGILIPTATLLICDRHRITAVVTVPRAPVVVGSSFEVFGSGLLHAAAWVGGLATVAAIVWRPAHVWLVAAARPPTTMTVAVAMGPMGCQQDNFNDNACCLLAVVGRATMTGTIPSLQRQEYGSCGDSYVQTRRRDTGQFVPIGNSFVNNRSVISHSPYLLLKYNAHINVECTAGFHAVKYIYKVLVSLKQLSKNFPFTQTYSMSTKDLIAHLYLSTLIKRRTLASMKIRKHVTKRDFT